VSLTDSEEDAMLNEADLDKKPLSKCLVTRTCAVRCCVDHVAIYSTFMVCSVGV